MSTPASLKGGPVTTNTLASKRFLWIYFLIIYVSSLPVIYAIWDFFSHSSIKWILTRLPLFALGWYFEFIFLAMIVAWVMLKVTNFIHKPREGVFPRNNRNIDFRYWSLRATIKKFPIWLTHNSLLPWIDIIAFKMFGVKVNGSVALFDAYVDTEFIDVGDKTTIGQGCVIMSSMITKDWLIIKKVKIGKGVLIGSHSVISPGTEIGDNVIIGAISGTTVGQKLESNWVYMGVPARKYRKNEYRSMEESDEEMAKKRQLFKQYLSIEDMEELEVRKKRKFKRAEKKEEKRIEKAEKKLEKHERKIEKHARNIENLQEKQEIEKNEKKSIKIKEKIENIRNKEEELREKMKELKEQKAIMEAELLKLTKIDNEKQENKSENTGIKNNNNESESKN